MSMVSPGVSVTITDQSFYIPASASTVPLIFIATRANKLQPDGVHIAAGTNEHSVVRTITSIGQSVETYGIPYFWKDNSGAGEPAQYHGDCRNEYGLFALNQFLGIGNLAYVVRANIDLTDSPRQFISAGIPVYDAGSYNYVGVGNGTLSAISVPSALKEPESFTLVCIGLQGTDTIGNESFTITGSKSGMIGVAKANGTAFVHSNIQLTITNGATVFKPGDYFEFNTVYAAKKGTSAMTGLAYTDFTVGPMTGNGTLIDLVPEANAVEENFIVEFLDATNFKVIGYHPVTNAITTTGQFGTVGGSTPFIDVAGKISFTILAGSTAFAAGDAFAIEFDQVQNMNPLGFDDATRRLAIRTALQAEINSNQDVRSEIFEYNLILCPGYPEVVDELDSLNDSISNEAFVIADVPVTKTPEQAANWANTSERIKKSTIAYYYPWCLSSNLDGYNVLVAPSGTALRTFAFSDNASELWFAPAGLRRGTVSGVESVGYVTGTLGLPTTYVQVNLNQGQRDALYDFFKNINPIVFFPTRGLVIWGQKTSYNATSARDRINVERLLCYIRRSLRKASMPFLFEPNDQPTRDDIKAMIDGFLGDIMMRRGLYDFVTLCDSSNNTPARIDRNELWVDIGIKPMKAVEFIIIPIRVLSTGAKMGTA
jgi:hypothetical protein